MIHAFQRQPPRLVDPDDSRLNFYQVLAAVAAPTLGQRLRALFQRRVTVAVPRELARDYRSGRSTLAGCPLWTYKLVDGKVFDLRPMPSISHL